MKSPKPPTEETTESLEFLTMAVLLATKRSLRRRRWRIKYVPRTLRLGSEISGHRVATVQRHVWISQNEWKELTSRQINDIGRLLAAQIKACRLRILGDLALPNSGCLAARAGFLRGVHAYEMPHAIGPDLYLEEPRFTWRFDVLGASGNA